MARIFIGVAWPYANNAQHFGHLAGVYLPADIFARFHRMKGNEVLMVSGSDMHGTPTTVAAEKEGVAPEVVAERFHKINYHSLEKFGISYDLFTHTSTPKHTEVVHDIFLNLYGKGYIYLATMNSSYCAGCNRFLPDRYVEGTCPHCGAPDARGDQCPTCSKLLDPEELVSPKCKLCGNPSEIRETEHFFLRLTAFQDSLSEYISDKNSWKAGVINFTRNMLAQGLRDRAVTRDIGYGVTIPVEGFESKRIYVWFEAVCGYLSASKAWSETMGDPAAWERFWLDPECMHYYFLGKDNIMFHTIIWPSILLGYGGLNLPYNVPANDHLTLGGEKISKSKTKDTSIWLPDYLDTYSPDPMRYYLTIHMPELHDTAFTWDEFYEKNNSELVGAYGNFIHRVLTFTYANIGAVPEYRQEKSTAPDQEAIEQIRTATAKMGEFIENCQFKNALETLMALAHFGNRYFNGQAPWKLIKEDRERCETVLNVSLRLVSAMAVLSAPFMPHSAERLWGMLGNSGKAHKQKWDDAGKELTAGTRLQKPEVLFTKLGEEGSGKMETGLERELAKLEMKIGKVVKVESHPNADKLYKLTVDLGNSETRTSVAGLKAYYTPEELEGKTVVVVTNLEPAVLRGIKSECMLLAADAGAVVSLLAPDGDAAVSERVGVKGDGKQLKFSDFQKMDLRVGIAKEVKPEGLVIDAGDIYTAPGISDAALVGKTVVIVGNSEKGAALLTTESGKAIATDKGVPPGSKVK